MTNAVALRPVMSVDISKINMAVAGTAIERYMKQVGAGGGGKSPWPGKQVAFSSGEWIAGFGDEKKKLKRGKQIVLNVPNLMLSWNTWIDFVKNDGEDGRRPEYNGVYYPALNDDMPERDTLGDLDKTKWQKDKKSGQPIDPWKTVAVFPCRDAKSTEINHIILQNKSSVIAALKLFEKVMGEMSMRAGQLPIVSLDSEIVERGKGEDKQKWAVPVFEVVDWIDADTCDNPGKGGIQVAGDDSEDDTPDVGEVVAKGKPKAVEPEPMTHAAAVAEKKREGEKKTTPKAEAAPKSTPKRRVEVEADDGDDTL